MTQPRRYIAVADGFLMVLRQGDDVFASLEALMRDERIAFGQHQRLRLRPDRSLRLFRLRPR